MICPICGKGELIPTFHKLGEIVGLIHSMCDYCEEWIVTPEQSRHNKNLIVNQMIFSDIDKTNDEDILCM